MMKFCTRCGRNLDDDAEFCPECGKSFGQRQVIYVDKRAEYGPQWLYLPMLISGVLIFCLTYFMQFYLSFLFFPIFFIGGLGRRGKIESVLSGILLGAVLGYIAGIAALFFGSML